MMKLIMKDEMDNLCRKNVIECPNCGHKNWFVAMIPLTCGRCKKIIANVPSMMRHKDERTMYHFRGKTLSQCNVI